MAMATINEYELKTKLVTEMFQVLHEIGLSVIIIDDT